MTDHLTTPSSPHVLNGNCCDYDKHVLHLPSTGKPTLIVIINYSLCRHPFTKYTMPKNILDKAIEAVPRFGDRISLFTKKLRLAQYADSTYASTPFLPISPLQTRFTQRSDRR